MGCSGMENGTQAQMGSLLWMKGVKEEQVQRQELCEAGPEQASDCSLSTWQASSCCNGTVWQGGYSLVLHWPLQMALSLV